MTPITLTFDFARLWMETSAQALRATTEFWGEVLGAPSSDRRRTSTAAPWWKAPETSSMGSSFPFTALGPWMQPPWFPSAPGGRPSADAMTLWQRTWMPLAPFPALVSGAPAFGAPWMLPTAFLPWSLPPTEPRVPDAWQPAATAYRTASGHAVAAVLRTMADAVEPQRDTVASMAFWPYAPRTRH